MTTLTPKKMACCSLCDEPIFTQGMSPLPGAKRSSLMLRGGTYADFSLCSECEFTEESMKVAWAKMLMAHFEAYTDKGKTEEEIELHREINQALASDIPLEVIKTQLWSEIM